MGYSFLRVAVVGCVAASSFNALPSRGDDAKPAAPATQPAMQMDQAAMMKAWKDYATPGPEHVELAKMVGTWHAQMEDMSSGEAQKSEGTAKFTMLMGGRYLMEEYSGKAMGMDFHGMMLIGYDNALKEYISTWIDDMGTGIAVTHGPCTPDGKIEMKGTMVVPMVDHPLPMRTLTTPDGDDKRIMEMFMPGPEGKEMMTMRVTYVREK